MPRQAVPYRPRVTPETRRLLIAAGLALATLWGLARVRFPDTPVTASPVPPLLAQLAPPPTFEQLASEVSRVRAQVGDLLVTIPVEDDAAPQPALRLRANVAAAVVPPATLPLRRPMSKDVVAANPATGLVLTRMRDTQDPGRVAAWIPQSLDDGEFLLRTAVFANGQTSFVPVFVSGLYAEPSRAWRGSVWRLPPGTRVPAGAFMFTTAGELAGVAVDEGPSTVIVPADVLRAAAEGLLDAPPAGGGWLGIEVAELTPSIARAARAQEGVIVSWVDPRGPAANRLAPGDVIESVESEQVTAPGQWAVSIARFAPGAAVHLHVRSNGAESDVTLTAAPPPAATRPSLGLHLRRAPGSGAEVTAVDAGSSAERAGLQAGDLITRAGTILRPSPAEVRAAYRDVTADRPLLLAVTRGNEHRVMVLEQ